MTDSGDAFRKQHDITEPLEDQTQTPEDKDDEVLEGGEGAGNLDAIHESATGDTDNLPIDEEVNKDEVYRVKDLKRKDQKKK